MLLKWAKMWKFDHLQLNIPLLRLFTKVRCLESSNFDLCTDSDSLTLSRHSVLSVFVGAKTFASMSRLFHISESHSIQEISLVDYSERKLDILGRYKSQNPQTKLNDHKFSLYRDKIQTCILCCALNVIWGFGGFATFESSQTKFLDMTFVSFCKPNW